MNNRMIWTGGMMVVAGVNLLAGSIFGYDVTWPLWMLGIGLLMILAPWAGNPAGRHNFRVGGYWTLLAGLAGTLAMLGLHRTYGPVFMIGAGVLWMAGLLQKKEA